MKNLDILLINSPSAYPGSMLSHRIQGLPPLGLGYIATYLKGHDYEVAILDFYIRTVTLIDLDNLLINNKIKMIGISTTTETYNCGINIALYIKEKYHDILIFMGGCHVTFCYKDALNSGVVDYVVRNEGELTVKELADLLLKKQGNLESIKGICYKGEQDNIIINEKREFINNLDELPIPDRNFFSLDNYAVPASISTSRGCPGNCIFCAASALAGGCYRTRSAGNIIKEIKYLKNLGFKHIQIVDDTMTANVKRLREFIDLMIKEKIEVTWNCESRVDIMSKELLSLMKCAGCISVQFGVEAGSQEMLDCLRKNVSIDQIRNVFIWAQELGMTTATCLIIGQPFDSKETIRNTVDFALELQELGARVVFSVSTPYPGTYMYNNPEKLGIEIVDYDLDNYTTQIPVYNTKNLLLEEIRTEFFDAFIRLGKGKMNEQTQIVLNRVKKHLKKEVTKHII